MTQRDSKGRFRGSGSSAKSVRNAKRRRKVLAKDRPLHDAFYALMLDRAIVVWYHDADEDSWYCQIAGDEKCRMLADPYTFLARRTVSARSLRIACTPVIVRKHDEANERLRRAFPLFADVMAVVQVVDPPTVLRSVSQEEALTLFAS